MKRLKVSCDDKVWGANVAFESRVELMSAVLSGREKHLSSNLSIKKMWYDAFYIHMVSTDVCEWGGGGSHIRYLNIDIRILTYKLLILMLSSQWITFFLFMKASVKRFNEVIWGIICRETFLNVFFMKFTIKYTINTWIPRGVKAQRKHLYCCK